MRKNEILTITLAVILISGGNSVGAKSFLSNSSSSNVAVVDVQRIVESSPAINALNLDRKSKIDNLVKFVEKAKSDVSKETDPTKRKALEDSYNKELNLRKTEIDKDYSKRLSEIDSDITGIIKVRAKKSGYDLTLSKSDVIDGGVNITDDIIKELK